MRALVSFLLILLLIGATTLDQVACPDGCTDEPAAHTSSSAASRGDCTICHGWVAPQLAVESTPPEVIDLLESMVVTTVRPPHHPSIEHPPRRAWSEAQLS